MRFALFLIALATPSLAEIPDITDAAARAEGGGTYSFSVTLRHPDTGWDHYADGWEVLDPDGNRLGYRELLHPHVHEQPFTRSLGGVTIPDGVNHVLIRAKCSVDGWGEATFRLDLPR